MPHYAMPEYVVKCVKQPTGIRYAVMYGGICKFMQKNKDKANSMIERLNRIQKERLENI